MSRLRTNTKISIKVFDWGEYHIVSIPARQYDYLAIHRNIDCFTLNRKPVFINKERYAITHIPTGKKLPFHGTLEQLIKFCENCGSNGDLWDSSLWYEHGKKETLISNIAKQHGLLHYWFDVNQIMLGIPLIP